jgi:SpoVK/Ycf46/Vps4 family AAA+-type ATPase
LVELDPSHFLRRGLENIYSQADEIFEDLLDLSETVVFFDEMDALTQSREGGIDVTRQFLTTSMLPKLSRLHDESRVLFFMATNHLRNFDDAIKRPGRFDLLIHVRPPLWTEKLAHLEIVWPGRKIKYAPGVWPDSQRKDDIDFVKKELASWVPSTGNIKDALDLFTPGELESFLENVGEGPQLRTGVVSLGGEDFLKRVDLWGKHYIALHSEKQPKLGKDTSLLDEYKFDFDNSRM